ncbi:prolyl oligopeptidase family serine peptidase [Candidatus Micrarchaeota archaeon]|nr:prolyl oligopeptidase family serine peptidase [Candidatus Micrarchaeota archaeon]
MNCPLLIIHGTNDELIPIEHARKLFEVANEPKELVEIKGADHNFSDEMHEKERQSRIIKWFEKWLKVKLGES